MYELVFVVFDHVIYVVCDELLWCNFSRETVFQIMQFHLRFLIGRARSRPANEIFVKLQTCLADQDFAGSARVALSHHKLPRVPEGASRGCRKL